MLLIAGTQVIIFSPNYHYGGDSSPPKRHLHCFFLVAVQLLNKLIVSCNPSTPLSPFDAMCQLILLHIASGCWSGLHICVILLLSVLSHHTLAVFCKLRGLNMFTQCVSNTFIVSFLWCSLVITYYLLCLVVLNFISGTEMQPI